MVKILHCSDMHLDDPVMLLSTEKAGALRKEIRGVLSALTLYIKSDGIDLMIVSGDLFDNRFATAGTATLLLREFASVPDCRIVIAPGAKDFISDDSIYKKYSFPKNVFIFASAEMSYFDFPEINTRVYGYALTSEERQENALPNQIPDLSPDTINLFCGQATVGVSEATVAPITIPQIRACGLDYMGIGGDHNGSGVERAGKTYYGVSGCLCGHEFSDSGYKGAVLIEADKDGESTHLRARGLRFFKRRFVTDTVNADGARSEEDIKRIIAEHILGKKYGKETALRIILTGSVSPDVRFRSKKYADELSELLCAVEIEDNTLPILGIDQLGSSMTLKDTAFRKLAGIIEAEGENSEKALTAARALRIASDAFDKSAANKR